MTARRITFLLVALISSPALGQPVTSGGDTAGSATAKAPAPVTGEQVYSQVCQACHMADARGGQGAAAIPALAKNPKLAEAGYPIAMVAQGLGAMPALTDILDSAQIAAVVTYVRTHFGNSYRKPVTAGDVKMVLGQ